MNVISLLLRTGSALALVLLAGCSTVSDVKEAKGEGVTRTFDYDYDQVWEASVFSVRALGLPIVASDKTDDAGSILASTPMQGTTWGENVAVFIEPDGPDKSTVEVISKRVLATNIFAEDWTDPLLSRISSKLRDMNAKPVIYLVQSAYDNLNRKAQEELDERYDVRFHNDKVTGRLIERQVQNISTPGSTTGSTVGSSLASAVYLDNALSDGSYNMWTDLAVGVMGGIAGAGANKAPTERYRIQYSIRNLDGEIRSTTVTRPSPIGAPVGKCFTLRTAEPIAEEFCDGMSTAEIKREYLN